MLGVDVTPWLRPDAETSPDRLFCHVHGRAQNTSQMIPGWPYSIVAALKIGPTSWTAVVDAVQLGPDDDATAVTAAQPREVVDRLIAAGHWRAGDPPIEIVVDSGYDVTRLAFLLADLPVVVTGWLRSDGSCSRPNDKPDPHLQKRLCALPWVYTRSRTPGSIDRTDAWWDTWLGITPGRARSPHTWSGCCTRTRTVPATATSSTGSRKGVRTVCR